MAMLDLKDMPLAVRNNKSEEFEQILTTAFRKAGLRIKRPFSAADNGADLEFIKDGAKYLVQLKVSSEGRSDRLIPLLSQVILQAQVHAKQKGATAPIAVVAARHIPAAVASQIRDFASRYAPEVGVGVIDSEGLRSFSGFGLEVLDAKPARSQDSEVARTPRRPGLFSDLNQWMLKILIGQRLPETLITVPREPIRNASQLANLAGVSVMSASRFVNQLFERSFLHKQDGQLQITRVHELLDLWISANRDAFDEIPARWILKKGPDQLNSALRAYAAPHSSQSVIKSVPRCCLALFAAADALGCGFVQGVPPHIYLGNVTLDALGRLGLVIDHSGRSPDVYIRKPANPESVFRAEVTRDGLPISDILQVWSDASTHPARGKEQAREIRHRALKSLFGRQP
jgi:hypothetical protein